MERKSELCMTANASEEKGFVETTLGANGLGAFYIFSSPNYSEEIVMLQSNE
jgi:hypothetical protein